MEVGDTGGEAAMAREAVVSTHLPTMVSRPPSRPACHSPRIALLFTRAVHLWEDVGLRGEAVG